MIADNPLFLALVALLTFLAVPGADWRTLLVEQEELLALVEIDWEAQLAVVELSSMEWIADFGIGWMELIWADHMDCVRIHN